jgi:hypothetical protein
MSLSMKISVIALFVSSTVLMAETESAQSPTFNSERTMETIRTLASDRFQGRQTGWKGGTASEQWMAEQIENLGLEPGGTDGYFQLFTLLNSQEKSASITLLDSPFGKIHFVYGDDFTLITNSGSGKVQAEAVIVGHGISKPDKGWDDYGDADVRGKIVVILRDKPPVDADWDEENSRNYTVNEAYVRGAKAVLYLQGERPIQGGAIQIKSYHSDLPSFYVRQRVVDLLLLNTGWNLNSYKKQLEKEPKVLFTGKRVEISAKVRTDSEAVGRNVMGWVRGSDPELSKEVIVVGAHLDHVGINGEGIIYNGADDNASGSAVVLELASCFASNPRPKRSILFQWYAAEESGLIGSKYWVDHPTTDVENVVAMLNFDMEGRGDGKVGIGGGEFYPDVWSAFIAALDTSLQNKVIAHRSWRGGSDQTSFLQKDIPAYPFYTHGSHPLYHVLDDDAQWIQPETVQNAGTIAQDWLSTLANWQGVLADSLSKERVIWTHNFQVRNRFVGDDSPDSVLADIANDRGIPVPFEWLWYSADDSTNTIDNMIRWADRWRTVINDADKVEWAASNKDAEGNIDDMKTAVRLGVADNQVLPDVQALRILRTLGVGLIRLTDPTSWLTADTSLAAEINEGKWQIVAPVSDDSMVSKVIGKLRSAVILWGNPETYASIDTTVLDSLTSWSGAAVITWAPPSNTALVKNQMRWLPKDRAVLNLDLESDMPLYQEPNWILRQIRNLGDLPDSTWTWDDVMGGNLMK